MARKPASIEVVEEGDERFVVLTATWLMPVPSRPAGDDRYQSSDSSGVNQAQGTRGDFVACRHAAKQRGLRVLIDPVVSHTSDGQRWFQEARRDPNSKHRHC